MKDQTATEKRDRDIIDIVKAKYADHMAAITSETTEQVKPQTRTATAIFSGPSIVFGVSHRGITLIQCLKKRLVMRTQRKFCRLPGILLPPAKKAQNIPAQNAH